MTINSKTKCTPENIDEFCDILKQNLADYNGRGEFDEETTLFGSIETLIGWIDDMEKEVKYNV